ncbi:MAG: N-acetyl-gamma-glutamyl-phosphate reductase, partial [Muribaculaceae bacterium]|nr:N-acetyl-gamma-glutamyl-phosphate reductase [Muribaculaceae bacterium]
MIKVGIIGADTPEAGELLRLLINHPEVEVETLYAPLLAGRQVSSCHHGFIGERSMNFTDRLDLSKIDAVFIL